MRRCLNVITHLSIHKKPKSMLQNTNAIYSNTNFEWRLEWFVSHCLLLDINVIVHFWADAHNRLAQIFFKATQQLQQTKHPNKCAIRWIRRKCKHLTLDRHTRNWYARRQIQCTQGKPIHSFWRQTTQPSSIRSTTLNIRFGESFHRAITPLHNHNNRCENELFAVANITQREASANFACEIGCKFE